MITLMTGLPGHGKTLFLLAFIKEMAEKQNREVFYSGITILDKVALPWTEFKAEEWESLPVGAIILIDEAQFVFSKKPNGSKLPGYYENLATHRHQGFDIFIATQGPKLIETFVRELVGQHFHAVRKFGLERNTIYEWSAVNMLPLSSASQKAAIPRKFPFPKYVYSWYLSAELHTVKKSIPMKIILVVLFIISMLFFGYYSLKRYQNRGEVAASVAAPVVQGGEAVPVSAVGGGRPGAVPFDAVADARNYVAMNTPRIEGLQFTAPKYDDQTKPTAVPIPAMCVQVGSVQARKQVTCRCYSQQATRLEVPFNMCIEFARTGFFREFDADRDRQDTARAERSVQALSTIPDSGPMSFALADASPPPVRMPAPPSAPREERQAEVPGPGGIYVR